MKIIISGYGKMGKAVEAICLERNHEVVAILDEEKDWGKITGYSPADLVVIDFSMPEMVVDNLFRSFQLRFPVVTGTTGWYNRLEEVKTVCLQEQSALFYASNFSLGVNVLFYMNKMLAGIMAKIEGYHCTVKETHHIHKLDAPSGTAIRLAEDILDVNGAYSKWVNHESQGAGELPVLSYREGEIAGIHEIIYNSETDQLMLKHEAGNRKGFALGAVLAAEFLNGKHGVFTMQDYLKTMGL